MQRHLVISSSRQHVITPARQHTGTPTRQALQRAGNLFRLLDGEAKPAKGT